VVLFLLLVLPYFGWIPSYRAKEKLVLADEPSSAGQRPGMEVSHAQSRTTLDHLPSPLSRFGQVRLDTPRKELQNAFDLHTATVSGETPEIYETFQPTGEQFTGCFADGLLKEAFVINLEKQAGPDALQQELIKQYGSPMEQIDSNDVASPPSLLSPNAAKDWVSRMASLPFHRNLVWKDGNYHIEAGIHYSSVDPAQSRAILAVHLHTTTSPLN